MRRYRMLGLTIESAVALEELEPAAAGEAAFVFRCRPPASPAQEPPPWIRCWDLPGGAPWLRLARRKEGLLLRFPGLADFEVSPSGRRISCTPAPDTPGETVRHLFLDLVIPLLLSHRGRIVLHGSAVRTPAGAAAFLGESGQGKSTLAAALCRAGAALLTDDCLLVEARAGRLFAYPGCPGVRLWPQGIALFCEGEGEPAPADRGKRRLSLGERQVPASSRAVPLERVYFLEAPGGGGGADAVAIERLSARDALAGLLRYACRLDPSDRERMSLQFEALSGLAALPLFARLGYRRERALLPELYDAILKDLRGE